MTAGRRGALNSLAYARRVARRPARHRPASGEAGNDLRELGDEAGLAVTLNNRGYADLILGEYERAEPLLRESLRGSLGLGR